MNPVADEASKISYACGLRDLAPFIRRMLVVEALAVRQAEQITALQSSVLRLKYPNVQIHSKETKNG